MNKIVEYYKNLSDQDLIKAIEEIIESEDKGIIGDLVRYHAKNITEIIGNSSSMDLFSAQISLLKEGAYRFYADNAYKYETNS